MQRQRVLCRGVGRLLLERLEHVGAKGRLPAAGRLDVSHDAAAERREGPGAERGVASIEPLAVPAPVEFGDSGHDLNESGRLLLDERAVGQRTVSVIRTSMGVTGAIMRL